MKNREKTDGMAKNGKENKRDNNWPKKKLKRDILSSLVFKISSINGLVVKGNICYLTRYFSLGRHFDL